MTETPLPFTCFLPQRDLAGLAGKGRTISPDADECAAIADDLGLSGLTGLRIDMTVRQVGRDSWRLDGRVFAHATQPCVVTLEPVEQVIDESFNRIFDPGLEDLDGDLGIEVDIDLEGDDPPEPLGDGIDVAAIALEHLALGIDPYPRATGADFTPVNAAPPGAAALPEGGEKPFAALEQLKKQMESGE